VTAIGIRLPRSSRRSAVASVGRGPRLVPLFFYTTLVIALFFAMIYLRVALDRSAFELDEIERSIVLEESRTLDLRLQIAELQDPLRIAGEAERIGLTYPDERIALSVNGVRDAAPPLTEQPTQALPGTRP